MATSSNIGTDPFGARDLLETPSGNVVIYRLDALEAAGLADLARIPLTVKVLLENLVRTAGTEHAGEEEAATLAGWGRKPIDDREFPFAPWRVILQDFTGVPAVVDLAAMRAAIDASGGDPSQVDPLVPVDLVIDHSVQVDAFGSDAAFRINVEREYERNHERYSLLRWAQQAFAGFRVVPPGMGIVHQVNLEYLGRVVGTVDDGGVTIALPDTLVGTDSHTTMINGLGVLGWGVGGIEAEAAMLGQPLPLLTPKVVGFRMTGALRTGVTATDLVLTVTEMLRAHGVVGKFVEFFGSGLDALPVADRATISNMCPEYGATAALFPVDTQTIDYMRLTGRGPELLDLVERYAKEQRMFRTDEDSELVFTETLELDLSGVDPSLAGPRRPQDRVSLHAVWPSFKKVFSDEVADGKTVRVEVERFLSEGGNAERPHTPEKIEPDEEAIIEVGKADAHITHGSVVIAAITSCTNTSNPSVMLGAGLLAKNAVERGLGSKPWVKTSLAPGSRVVTRYLEGAELVPYLEALGFHTVGYGCTTCIGNSGPLPEPISETVDEHNLAVVSVLSGNRNFEGRIHPQVKASYLASPPLVVAYALAGTIDVDLDADPIGEDATGEPVYLRDIWPSHEEIGEIMSSIRPELFIEEYAKVFEGEENWKKLPSPIGHLFDWDPDSTYVQEPPFFTALGPEPRPFDEIEEARVLVKIGDSVTTDHISPAGAIPPSSPAGRYLIERGVEIRDFNSYGSRRGNHKVMMRGTFGSIRLKNHLVAPREGGFTRLFPESDEVTIFDAATRYRERGTPLIVIAGKEYGSGSSRDWAAKGPSLLGVKAVIAESFERIHRSNLVGMGVLPLQFMPGENAESLDLTGEETYGITGIAELEPHAELTVVARREDGERDRVVFQVEARVDSAVELDYYRHGGVLQMVLRRMLAAS